MRKGTCGFGASWPRVFKNYRDLYIMSREARYRDGHRLGDNRRKSAVGSVGRIEDELPF